DLLMALLDEHVDAPMRDRVAVLASAPPERDMAVEATEAFARQLDEEREAVLLEREYWTLAIRDPDLRARYVERQTALRVAVAALSQIELKWVCSERRTFSSAVV